jgi:hypothetical protein
LRRPAAPSASPSGGGGGGGGGGGRGGGARPAQGLPSTAQHRGYLCEEKRRAACSGDLSLGCAPNAGGKNLKIFRNNFQFFSLFFNRIFLLQLRTATRPTATRRLLDS